MTIYICICIKVTPTSGYFILGLLLSPTGSISILKHKSSLHDSFLSEDHPMPFSSRLNFQRKTLKMYTLLSRPRSNCMHTHVRGSTPTSLAYPRLFFSKQEAVDSFPGIFRIPYLQEKPQLLFQSSVFFPPCCAYCC